MWIIGNSNGVVPLIPGKTYMVGRKGCEIIIEDKSVSRNHAEIFCDLPTSEDVKNLKQQSPLYVVDRSRFGTCVNKKRISKDEKIALSVNDSILFGTNSTSPLCIFTISLLPLVSWYRWSCLLVHTFCSSNLSPEVKQKLPDMVAKIDGKLTEDITQCNYLVMLDLRVTVKTLHALVEGIPIVHPSWLQEVANLKPGNPLPPPEEFLPPKSKGHTITNIEMFKVNKERKHLFKGLTFVYFTQESYNKTHSFVTTGQGQIVKAFETSIDETFVKAHKDAFYVNPTDTLLNNMNLKIIDDEQIGLFVLHASTSTTITNGSSATNPAPTPLPTTTNAEKSEQLRNGSPPSVQPPQEQAQQQQKVTAKPEIQKDSMSTDLKRTREEESDEIPPVHEKTESMVVQFASNIVTRAIGEPTLKNCKKFKKAHGKEDERKIVAVTFS